MCILIERESSDLPKRKRRENIMVKFLSVSYLFLIFSR